MSAFLQYALHFVKYLNVNGFYGGNTHSKRIDSYSFQEKVVRDTNEVCLFFRNLNYPENLTWPTLIATNDTKT